MESLNNIGKPEISEIIIDENGKKYLSEAAKWAKFLAIIGFIGMGFVIIAGIIMIVAIGSFPLPSNEPSIGMGQGFRSILGFFYLVFALVYFFPLSQLYKFATKTKKALNNDDSHMMSLSFEAIKSLFKFFGIFTISMIVLYIVIILGFIFLDFSGKSMI